VSLIYSFFGSFVTHIAGRYLIPLSFIKQRVEADYRHTAMQVRDHTESIALYGSEDTEHHRLSGRFDRIQRVVWEQMKVSKQLSFFRNFYSLSNDIAPFCILAGNYFRGQITLGQLMQILGALGHVSNSLNSFVDAYTSIADFRATADRLYNFWVGVDKGAAFVESQTMAKEVSPPGDTAALYAQNVCVALPGDRKLWDNAGLVVQPGERVLLLGKDGCGKSVFLRSIAGCWPASGSVRIGRGDALFIPQKPFVPAGELREALAYPEQVSSYSDEEMIAAIGAVGLTALNDVPLSEESDWSIRLSGGEMQRLALAHALLRKPGLLVLDETTAAIGEEQTAELYAVLAKLLPPSTAVISVDHDAISEVGNWHNVHYTADPETRRWKLSSREVS
jgi:putative ATP-binding cassette transporter